MILPRCVKLPAEGAPREPYFARQAAQGACRSSASAAGRRTRSLQPCVRATASAHRCSLPKSVMLPQLIQINWRAAPRWRRPDRVGKRTGHNSRGCHRVQGRVDRRQPIVGNWPRTASNHFGAVGAPASARTRDGESLRRDAQASLAQQARGIGATIPKCHVSAGLYSEKTISCEHFDILNCYKPESRCST